MEKKQAKKARYIWHLTARDVHATYENQSFTDKEGKKQEAQVETLHFNTEKLFFDSRDDAHRYINTHIMKYNSDIPSTACVKHHDLYQILRIDKQKVPEYESIFIAKQRAVE